MKSIEMNVVKAMTEIIKMESVEEIDAFILGDERKTVHDSAQKRIFEISGIKQGEQAGPITQKTSDFKEGIEGTKNVGADLVSAQEGQPQGVAPTKTYITGEDVIKTLRAQGKKI